MEFLVFYIDFADVNMASFPATVQRLLLLAGIASLCSAGNISQSGKA